MCRPEFEKNKDRGPKKKEGGGLCYGSSSGIKVTGLDWIVSFGPGFQYLHFLVWAAECIE